MRPNKTIGMAFALFVCVYAQTKAQDSMTIQLSDGTEQYFVVMNIQNITFSDNSLVLNLNNGTTSYQTLSLINKLYFSANTNNSLSTSEDTQVIVYPNPVSDFLILKNVPKGNQSVYFYRVDGVLSKQILLFSGDEQVVDVSSLVKGLYIVKVNNQAFKIWKK
jgi:hypothetical protein